jgi:hypothetical protein
MTDMPKRRRGRPTKEEAAARAAAQSYAAENPPEMSFLDMKLSEPAHIGRKPKLVDDEDTRTTLFELGKLFCTQEEAAAVLRVHVKTLQNFFNANEEVREIWEDGLKHAKISLRRKQLSLADKNAPAAIFLGKNYLGQKDEQTVNTNHNHTATEMTDEQLLELASRGAEKKRAPADERPASKEKLN